MPARPLRYLLLAALVLGTALPATAGATDSSEIQVVAGSRAIDALIAGRPQQAMIEGLVDAGANRELVTALAEGAMSEQLVSAPDLNGDGLRDVVGLARASQPGQSTTGLAETLSLTARSGINGSALWTAQVPGQTGFVEPDPQGVLVVTTEAIGLGHQEVALHLTAFSSQGAQRWQRTDRGVLSYANVDWPMYRGSLKRADGTVARLVQLLDYSYLVSQTVEPGVLDTIVIGQNGTEISRKTDTGQGVAWSYPLADLNGDGSDEIAYTRAFAYGASGTLTARTQSSVDLWSVTGAPFRSNGFIQASADATGDGVPDVAVSGSGNGVALYSGANGEEMWNVDGEWSSLVGDVDHDGLADIGVRTVGVDTGTWTLGTEHAAYSGDGRQLYREVTSTEIPDSGFSSLTTTYLVTGDFDGDGHADTLHEIDLVPTDGSGTLLDEGAVSGATGKRIWDGRIRLLLGGVVQGPGEDFANILQSPGSGVAIDAIDGRTNEVFWRAMVPASGTGLVSSAAQAADLNGDGAGEVIATVVRNGDNGALVQTGVVLDGRDGSILWS